MDKCTSARDIKKILRALQKRILKQIMCLYPKFIHNAKYLPTKKNGGKVPEYKDIRTLYVPIGCGNCIECRKQKARAWQVRLNEELKVTKHAYFVTLTFSPEELQKLCEEKQLKECNAVAATAVRRMLERIRKKYKKLPFKHWLITELGHENTERIHLHGILFSDIEISNNMLTEWWKYGKTDTGQYCNIKSINYIVKYVTKIDNDHKTFRPQIFCSAGLGKRYVNHKFNKEIHKYKENNTVETYTLNNGVKINLPIYYRNKFFDEDTRELLWLEKLDKGKIWVNGIECDISTEKGRQRYYKVLQEKQHENKFLGYGDRSNEWKQEEYNITLRMLNKIGDFANSTLQNEEK